MNGFLPRLLVVAACGVAPAAHAQPTDAAKTEFFEKRVRPLLAQHCQSCHGADPKKVKAGLRLTTRAEALAGGDAGPALAPGDPAKSLLVQVVKYDGDLKMPPKGRLKDSEIADLTAWVKDGAVWPGAAPAAVAKKPGGPLFTDEQKRFWAFQPVKRPPVPATPANPIDAFVLAKLAEKRLTPAPPADPRTLLRRVTFDLTGLPPTPAEVEAFLADQSPDAFAKVVDRLLASPAYGERWARHWLDVARYADSNGLDENTAFGNAWKYRDYVVASLNADKPYDQFLREQIAGDLLPPSDDPAVNAARLTATGYLVLGPKLLAEPDKQKMMIDIADEQLDTVGKGVLGLTLGCARCHDHKFDPIPTRDYYSLLGVFTSTRTMQGLGTVAKAFERTPGAPETADQKAARTRLDTLRKDLKALERKFGQTPATEKEKRSAIHEEAEKKRAEIKTLEKAVAPAEFVLAVEDGTAGAYGTQPRNVYVQVRGNYATPGEEAPAVFPRIVSGESQTPFVPTKPNPGDKAEPNKTRFGQVRERSGRLEFANWVADAKNPLTARVMVNRVWQHHFGEGIVRTPDNFGKLGERPTHPELLDWLASEFVANGWSLKTLHRQIVLSATYQTGTAHDAKAALADPDNRLLWRFNRRRLEAEAIRDGMLAAAGTLDPKTGGSLLDNGNFEYVTNDQSRNKARYDAPRRSLYLPVIRNAVFDFFQSFDFVEPHVATGKRASTVVAPQSLYLMNNPFVVAQAKAFADSLLKADGPDESRVKAAYLRAFARPPGEDESARAVSFVNQYLAALGGAETDAAGRRAKAWAAWCQVLFASSEFAYLN